MDKLLKPASLLMYVLVILVFFLAGMTLAGLSGVAKDQGLASGAIVLFYGIIAAIFGFISSLFTAYSVDTNKIIRTNKIFGVLLLLALGLIIYRGISKQSKEVQSEEYPNKTTKPANSDVSLVSYKNISKAIGEGQNKESNIGVGFFKPNFFEFPTIYFYGGVNFDKGLLEHSPVDSVVFSTDQYNNPTNSYAPPWLFPEHLKLDYGIITFKVLGLGQDFLKIEVNKQTKQFAYIDKSKGTFMSWREFLLSVNSVEFLDNNTQKVFIKPLDYASEVIVKYDFMQPLLIENDWMYVRLVDEDFKEKGKGWIQWKGDNVLYIAYSLLS